MLNKTCKICFKQFNHGRSDKKICSKECHRVHKNNKRRPKGSPIADGTQDKNCAFCDKSFKLTTPNKMTCSKKCLKLLNDCKYYGVDLKTFRDTIGDGRCNICNTTDTHQMCVDHCHKTGKFRGYLCSKCNTGLGYFNDNSAVLKMAARYLEKFNVNVDG